MLGLFKPKTKKVEEKAKGENSVVASIAPVPDERKKGKTVSLISEGSLEVRDIIAPSAIEVDFDHIKIANKFYRTLFVSGYPRFVGANWLEPIINFDHSLLISMFYYPVEARGVLDDLRRKIAEMEATLSTDRERGRVVDPAVQAALDDAGSLQEQLVKGMERFFQFSFYITIPADSLEELDRISNRVESALGSLMLISKHATLQMEDAFQSTLPTCQDKLYITRNMDTTSVATTFPFTSSELSANEGILYGVNKHNGSLIIFDRFTLENANSVIFAKSGAGKSYFVKIEIIRSLLFGTEVMIIDPESEYKKMCEAMGGDYLNFSIDSTVRINPFDLPEPILGEERDQLGLKILTLHTLFKIMLGSLTSTEEAVLDNALMVSYKLKGITQDPSTQRKEPPVMQDLYKVLLSLEEPEAKTLSERLERYIRGSLAGIFDQRSNVDIKNRLTVFSVQNLEDILRPIAIYIILDFVWTKIKGDLKKRILVVDEAWYLMQNADSAEFLFSIAKRARKYYLGLSTITQDVSDFLSSEYGKTIITNSSLQILLKQHPASIDQVAEVFYLSEGEKRLLLSAGVGEGLFFAGSNHVAMQVVASEEEHKLITTNPAELIKMKEEEGETKVEKLKKKFSEAKSEPTPTTPAS
ncbi:MAG: ATP-binding protein [Patescibacteria group bacterium]|nr:ATP-binding protein [Patescibacteria group bacterium]MBU4381251.1 ATP-binding protein [Patescibacteria group bacterium]